RRYQLDNFAQKQIASAIRRTFCGGLNVVDKSANRSESKVQLVSRLDERLLRDGMPAIRTSCSLGQDKLACTTFARHVSENPVERHLGITWMAVLAGLN